MYPKLLAADYGMVDLGEFYAGLQLRYVRCDYKRDSAAVRIIKNGQNVGSFGLDFNFKLNMLKAHTMEISPDFRGQGICTTVLNYLHGFTTDIGKSCLIFSTENYAVLRIAQTKLSGNTRYIRYPEELDMSITQGELLRDHDILGKNNLLNVQWGFAENIIFNKNHLGQWETQAPYTLHIGPSARVWVSPNSRPNESLPNALFYISPFYTLRLPV